MFRLRTSTPTWTRPFEGHLSSGPARMAIDRAGEEATRAAIVDALEAATQPDGSIKLDNVFKVVIARA